MVMLNIEGPHTGLALATSGSAYLNAGLLYLGLRKQGIYKPLPGWRKISIQIFTANLCMAAFLVYFSPTLNIWNQWQLSERIPYLLGFVVMAMMIYLISLIISGFRSRLLHH